MTRPNKSSSTIIFFVFQFFFRMATNNTRLSNQKFYRMQQKKNHRFASIHPSCVCHARLHARNIILVTHLLYKIHDNITFNQNSFSLPKNIQDYAYRYTDVFAGVKIIFFLSRFFVICVSKYDGFFDGATRLATFSFL